MKKLLFTCLLSGIFLTAINAQYGVERTGYEGDYFSLEGAIELFKESSSINNFERKLNQEDSWVNNLDLNYDGDIDYIRVEHRSQGDFHAVVLQAILGRREVQDVAVIEIERTGRRTAVLQIIGDPDLYGEEVIAEPFNNAGYSRNGDYDFSRGYVNVYYWRPVQRIFDRSYVRYVSPYRWNNYPSYWSPWRQHGWSVYHPRRVRYFSFCHIVYVHRVVHVHNFYRPFRSHSPHFSKRARKHRRTYGSSIAHRSHGKRNHTYRSPVRNQKGSTVAPRNSLGSRTIGASGRKTTVSPRRNGSTNTSAQRRTANTRSRSSIETNRSRVNSQVTNRGAEKTRVQSNRSRGDYVSKSSTRSEPSSRTRSTTKTKTTRTSQTRASTSKGSSSGRTVTKQKQKSTQTRTAPTKTQQRGSKAQLSGNRSYSTKSSSSARKSSAPRKSASPKRSAQSKKSSSKRSTSSSRNSSSSRKSSANKRGKKGNE